MAAVYRCDGCGTETPCTTVMAPSDAGWLCLDEYHGQHSRHFCGWPCLAEFATARVLVDGATEAGP